MRFSCRCEHNLGCNGPFYGQGVICMPNHKARKTENQQNKSSILEESKTLKPKKAADYVPSLNEIPKNES